MVIGLLIAGVFAAEREENVLPWPTVGLFVGANEEAAFGPDHLTGGPNGYAAVFDPVGDRVLVLENLKLTHRFYAPNVDDLAFTADGQLVLLQGRQLRLTTLVGGTVSTFELPRLAPTNLSLLIEDDRIWGVDAFGNYHRLATYTPEELQPGSTPHLLANPYPVSRVDDKMILGHWVISVPMNSKAAIRPLGADVVIVESIATEGPVTVIRHIMSPQLSVAISIEDRPYIPSDDVALDTQGRWLWLEPKQDGLHLIRVTP